MKDEAERTSLGPNCPMPKLQCPNCKKINEIHERQMKAQTIRIREMERIHTELMNVYEKDVSSLKSEIQCLKQSQEKLLNKFKTMQKEKNTQLKLGYDNSKLPSVKDLKEIPRNETEKFNATLDITDLSFDNLDKIVTLYCYGIEEEAVEFAKKDIHSSPAVTSLIDKIDKSLSMASEFIVNLQNSREIMLKKQSKVLGSEIFISQDETCKKTPEDLADAWSKINWEKVLFPEASDEVAGKDSTMDELQTKLNTHVQKLNTLMNSFVDHQVQARSQPEKTHLS